MRWMFLCALLLAGCSKGAEADLAAIGEARSLTAEWALVNQQSANGRLTATYTETMRKELREQLQSTSSELTQPNSRYSAEIEAVLKLPDDASPQVLRAHAGALKRQEDNLESA